MTDTSPLIPALRPYVTNIFTEMSQLANQYGAVNLGQGFPDEDGPIEMIEVAAEALRSGKNQYPPGSGCPELRDAIAQHQQRFYGLSVDPNAEVLVTVGASEGIAASLASLVQAGDEVIVFEPFYDSYAGIIDMIGAVKVPVPLYEPSFRFEDDELRAAITERTRAIIVNSPHNPTGKVFDDAMMRVIAEVACQHDLWVIADEVYEHLVFDGAHVPMAALPGMRERTLTVSSAAKTFSFTGWKVGWVIARPDLISAVRTAKLNWTFTHNPALQMAVAHGLLFDDSYFEGIVEVLRDKRDFLIDGLKNAGFQPFVPGGTYFVSAGASGFGIDADRALCDFLVKRDEGVAAIPLSAFTVRQWPTPWLRFAFCKRIEVLEEAVTRLQRIVSA